MQQRWSFAIADRVAAMQHGHRRSRLRAKAAGWHVRGRLGADQIATAWATHGMIVVGRDVRADLGQLPHVLRTHSTSIPQHAVQHGLAGGTAVGMMVAHRVDMVGVRRVSVMFGMPRLPTFGASAGRTCRARRRRGRIGGGRFGRVLGMLIEPRFEVGEALTKSRILLLKLHDHLLVLSQNGE